MKVLDTDPATPIPIDFAPQSHAQIPLRSADPPRGRANPRPLPAFRVVRAQALGFCFGVRDAIALAETTAASQPVTILGELVHNPVVLERLRARGVTFAAHPGDVRTPAAMITAHGASEKMLDEVRARGLRVLEATCPLVQFAHRSLAKLVAAGFHSVVIGVRGHVEVRGLTEDLEAADIVLSEAEVDRLPERARFGVIAQTTQPIDRVEALVARLRARFPTSEVRFIDTVCQPTKQRQEAAEALARRCDVVVVLGGAHSNNTRELAATCRRHCARVHHVQGVGDLQAEWFRDALTVGLTAGTSTPDDLIHAVESRLREIAAI
jgi:4-hydroxy-3-methylbut-2-enyl diphosphate reductase